ncbi:MAG TPA: ABC transporter permease [Acetobacteraceae bacterium]|nr:ABC transporter permease [Acetobacteraceae bacterium]
MAETQILGATAVDERVRRVPLVQRLVLQPALGSAAGFVLLVIFFAFAASGSGMFRPDGIVNWLEVSGELGLIAIAAALLMIAGEFDLSIGSMIGFSGMVVAIPSVYWGVPVWGSILIALACAVALGLLNGYLVVRTGLPSFIVTLAFLYILRGLTLAFSILFTGRTVVSGVNNLDQGDPVAALFGGHVLAPLFRLLAGAGLIATYKDGSPTVPGIPSVVAWWLVLAVIFHLVLTRTRLGNHIFASGGDANAARNLGVPVARVKMLLFATTALCAAIYGINQVIEFGSASADRGLNQEFEAIIAAVIGGSLLTGGYGSVIGACFGALIFGVTEQGIYFANWPSDWFRVFLGTMLLIAVLFNSFIRRRAMGGRG